MFLAKNSLNTSANYRNIIIFILASLAICYLLWQSFSAIIIYLALALVVAAILKTPTNYLAQIQIYGSRIPRVLAIIISFSILFSIFSLFIYLFVPLASEQFKTLSSLNFDDFSAIISQPITKIENLILQSGIIAQEPGFIINSLKTFINESLISANISSVLNSLLSVTGNFFVGLLVVLFTSSFFLYEKSAFRRYFISLIPNKYFEVSIAALSKTEKLLSDYLLGLLLQMTSIFTIVSFGLIISGVKYAITIALFAAVANLIPFLGPIIGASFGLIVGLSTMALTNDTSLLIVAIKIGIVFAIVQLSDNLLLQPIIFSRTLKAHPLAIFFIVLIGGTISSNPLGMIVAIPIFTVFRVLFGELYRGFKQYQIFRN